MYSLKWASTEFKTPSLLSWITTIKDYNSNVHSILRILGSILTFKTLSYTQILKETNYRNVFYRLIMPREGFIMMILLPLRFQLIIKTGSQ